MANLEAFIDHGPDDLINMQDENGQTFLYRILSHHTHIPERIILKLIERTLELNIN